LTGLYAEKSAAAWVAGSGEKRLSFTAQLLNRAVKLEGVLQR